MELGLDAGSLLQNLCSEQLHNAVSALSEQPKDWIYFTKVILSFMEYLLCTRVGSILPESLEDEATVELN